MTSGLTAGPAAGAANDTLRFVSLMSENAREFCSLLVAYLADRVGLPCDLFDGPWQAGESELYAGLAHLGIVCGLQYVLSVDRNDSPGVEVLAAPVMRGQRYGGQPVHFSDVVVRRTSDVRTFADLRGGVWAYNEPTSHSGYNLARYALAIDTTVLEQELRVRPWLASQNTRHRDPGHWRAYPECGRCSESCG